MCIPICILVALLESILLAQSAPASAENKQSLAEFLMSKWSISVMLEFVKLACA